MSYETKRPHSCSATRQTAEIAARGGKSMKIKCFVDGEIYEVLEVKGEFYQVRGIYLGIPILIHKSDCEIISEKEKQ